jgi:cytochrome b involved in lipid metabolism
MIDFKTHAEFEEYTKTTNQKLIAFEGTVYEVGDYMGTHPGGGEKIEELIGKVIDEAFEEAEHTQSARLIFRDLTKIGLLVGEDDKEKTVQPKGVDGFKLQSKLNLDYTKPMFQQLMDANLGWDEYV